MFGNFKKALCKQIILNLWHDICQKILRVDQIYHLAWPASPKDYQYNAIKTIKTNNEDYEYVRITKKEQGKILLSSTSEVCGD